MRILNACNLSKDLFEQNYKSSISFEQYVAIKMLLIDKNPNTPQKLEFLKKVDY